MRPEADQILLGACSELSTSIAPALPGDYATGTLNLIGMMMFMVAGEYDRAADVRHTDIEAMRALLHDGLTRLPDLPAPLRAALEAATAAQAGSLRIAALDTLHDQLAAALTGLHAHVEERPDGAAGELAAAIWSLLIAMADRHMPMLPIPPVPA